MTPVCFRAHSSAEAHVVKQYQSALHAEAVFPIRVSFIVWREAGALVGEVLFAMIALRFPIEGQIHVSPGMFCHVWGGLVRNEAVEEHDISRTRWEPYELNAGQL